MKGFLCLALLILLSGCVDQAKISAMGEELSKLEAAFQLQKTALKSAQEKLDSIAVQLGNLESRETEARERLERIKAESPTISACIMEQLAAKGLLTGVFAQSSAESTAGWVVGGVCFLAQMHADYPGVSAQIDEVANERSSIKRDRDELSSAKIVAEADLQRVRMEIEEAGYETRILAVSRSIDCERRMRCRLGLD